MYYTRTKLGKTKTPKTCGTKFGKFLENTTTWKIKSSTSSLDLCAPTKLTQISVGSEQDEAEIQYDPWSTPEWCNCEKHEKISTS